MGIFSWIIFGLIAGMLAKFIMPGNSNFRGCLVTILLGILGAVIGGIIGTQLGWGKVTGFNLRSFGLAVTGALILLWLYRVLKR